MYNKKRLEQEIIRASGGKIDAEAAKGAAGGDVNRLISGLSDADKAKLNAVLSDENATRQLLSSDAAKSLMKILFGGK